MDEQVIKFSIKDQDYFVSVDHISEIIDIDSVRKMSVTEDHIIGVTDVRDDIVQVVNTAMVIGEDDDNTYGEKISNKNLLYINNDSIDYDKNIGLLVDSVHRVKKVSNDDISGKDAYDEDVVKGIIKEDDDNMVVWLDIFESDLL